MFKIFIILILLPLILNAQNNKENTVWESFQYFAGSWVGHETGHPELARAKGLMSLL